MFNRWKHNLNGILFEASLFFLQIHYEIKYITHTISYPFLLYPIL